MSLSPEERLRLFKKTVKKNRRSSAYRNNYRNDSYETTSSRDSGYYTGPDTKYEQAGYRKPAGSSYSRNTQSGRSAGRTAARNAHRRAGSGRTYPARRRREQRRRRQRRLALIVFLLILIAVITAAVIGVRAVIHHFSGDNRVATLSEAGRNGDDAGTGIVSADGSLSEGEGAPGGNGEADSDMSEEDRLLAEANTLALQYDYDSAIELINSNAALSESEEGRAAVTRFEEAKSSLVKQDISEITHVFFHILVVDEDNAFDKSRWGKQADGYNQVMTTVGEFRAMLDKFYEDGFVLVGLHDMAEMKEQEDGSEKMTAGTILLPPGKKAMVMSQDDVCYYEYMEGAGFADRMIVGEDGRPTCVYTDPDGTEVTGEYDLVPILDSFIDEHPDFSYRGAKACIALTGYNGILGYRTDETYDPDSDMYDSSKEANLNIEEDREKAREVVKALKADGYEIASHSWGHRDYGKISFEHMKTDADRWEKNVDKELLGGECDIILYPFGGDVEDWHNYTHSNEKFDYLWNLGFRYFCNVDSSQYWVQQGEDYLRQGRRNLDGYAMWKDISKGAGKLSDLFDASEIFSDKRPTPVPGY